MSDFMGEHLDNNLLAAISPGDHEPDSADISHNGSDKIISHETAEDRSTKVTDWLRQINAASSDRVTIITPIEETIALLREKGVEDPYGTIEHE